MQRPHHLCPLLSTQSLLQCSVPANSFPIRARAASALGSQAGALETRRGSTALIPAALRLETWAPGSSVTWPIPGQRWWSEPVGECVCPPEGPCSLLPASPRAGASGTHFMSQKPQPLFKGPSQAAGPPGKEEGPDQQPPAMGGSFWRPRCFLPGGVGPPALGRTALGGPGKLSSLG